jgi:hypothetical protein
MSMCVLPCFSLKHHYWNKAYRHLFIICKTWWVLYTGILRLQPNPMKTEVYTVLKYETMGLLCRLDRLAFSYSSWIYACLIYKFLQAWNIGCNCIGTLYIERFFYQTLEWENSHYIAFAPWSHTCTCSDRFFNQSNKIMNLTPIICMDVKKERCNLTIRTDTPKWWTNHQWYWSTSTLFSHPINETIQIHHLYLHQHNILSAYKIHWI